MLETSYGYIIGQQIAFKGGVFMFARTDAIKAVEEARSKGKKVGFTSGVFDLLHVGHVEYLAKSKKECDFLVVGVNSDSSVRALKGDKRPIQSAEDRAATILALKSVDVVFIFEEGNNNQNISLLKPDYYLKAGDYSESQLSSAKIVREYGGDIKLIEVVAGRSSTAIIDTVLSRYADTLPSAEVVMVEERPALFVDRDGVINDNLEYVHTPEQFHLLPGALESLKAAQEKGYRIIVVTNQAGIGLGYFSKEDFYRVNRKLLKAASAIGLSIDGVYYCPHAISDKCSCRKPLPGMILRAAREKRIVLNRSFMIGDRDTDLLAGRAAGCRVGFVGAKQDEEADFYGNTLAEVISAILHEH